MEEWKEVVSQYLFSHRPTDLDFKAGLEVKNNNIPDNLFKYYSISKNSLKSFEKGTMWFSSPLTFNDPYDTAVKFQLTDKFKNDLLKPQIIQSLIKSPVPISEEDIQYLNDSTNIIEDGLKVLRAYKPWLSIKKYEMLLKLFDNVWNSPLKLQNRLLNLQIRDGFRVSCFSESLNSMSMWYHYAKGHTGFVLEYKFTTFDVFSKIRFDLWPVFYKDNLFDITPYVEENIKGDKNGRLLNTYASILKSKDWSYEKEWRLILNKKDYKNGFSLSFPKPVAIYLGEKIRMHNKSRLKNIAFKKNIPIYQMRPSEYSYKMKPKLIKSDTKI